MSTFLAALPMYDWPETRSATDAEWAALRDRLRARGIDAPHCLTRRNADMPAVPGGIRDADGALLAPDPAGLPPDVLDLHTLWHHPALLFAQTCRGPMELGLAAHVRVVGEADYSAYDGGARERYSSAILMRADGLREREGRVEPPADGSAAIPLERLRASRLAYNGPDSMSGLIALGRDLEAAGESLESFSRRQETGSHRASAYAVAEGRADACAVDCRTWALIRRFEPAASELAVVGWTAQRKGLPYVLAAALGNLEASVREALRASA